MAYTAELSRTHPGCILFLIDRSGSMSWRFGGDASITKKQGLADVLNRLIQNLIIRCTRADGVRNYFDIGVIAYGQIGGIQSALGGALAGRYLVPIRELQENPLRIEDRIGGALHEGGMPITTKLPIWVEPVAQGKTDMCAGLRRVHVLLSEWISRHRDSYPPIVIHISDGGTTDGDPVGPARDIMSLSTTDGGVLLFNCHISSLGAGQILFPSSPPQIRDRYAATLFEMSSLLPAAYVGEAQTEGFQATEGARGFGFNADMVHLIQFLEIGTRSVGRRLL